MEIGAFRISRAKRGYMRVFVYGEFPLSYQSGVTIVIR
jgi:hypothetical protein